MSAVRGPLRGDWGDPSLPRTQTLGLHPLRLAGRLRPPWGALLQGFVTARASPRVGRAATDRQLLSRFCHLEAGLRRPTVRSGPKTCSQKQSRGFGPVPSARGAAVGPGRQGTAPAPVPLVHAPSDRRRGMRLRMERRWGPGFPHPGWWGPPGLSAWWCCRKGAGLSSGLTWVLLTWEG